MAEKEADIVLLRTDQPNVLPFNNACGAIVPIWIGFILAVGFAQPTHSSSSG
jgi:hypothetical protein